MHFLLPSFIAVLSASSISALQTRDVCGEGYGEIISGDIKVCCPGTMKTDDTTTYCCLGGSDTGCGQVTCFDDLSSCKGKVDVSSPDYASTIASLTGSTPPFFDDSGDAAAPSTGTTESEPSGTSTTPSTTSDATGGGSGDAAAPSSGTTKSEPSGTSTTPSTTSDATGDSSVAGVTPLWVVMGALSAVSVLSYAV
ncbi:hypothetical protein V490_07510 [Pseudogymnoascus sp. VKM F-3557]|nr:hypothetical protein V490_07510 [Pseudogymnoascus sp. VKM F-3557]